MPDKNGIHGNLFIKYNIIFPVKKWNEEEINIIKQILPTLN